MEKQVEKWLQKEVMVDFREFSNVLRSHVLKISTGEKYLFVVNPDNIWETYLESFPTGTNEVYRERREYDCSCCRHFVKSFGNVVVIKNNKVVSIWDFKVEDPKYQAVLDAMSNFVRSKTIDDVFVSDVRTFGVEKNHERREDGTIHTWYHFYAQVSDSVKVHRKDDIGSIKGKLRDSRNVLQRSFEELTPEAIDTVLDLIAQNSLYKGEEWKGLLEQFKLVYDGYQVLSSNLDKDNYCWTTSLKNGPALSRIRNHSIGTLLVDLSDDMDLNEAVKRYESIVAPTNYKRPKAIFTKRMLEEARKKVVELGFMDSLGRRHASLEDVSINNVLFANRDAAKRMTGDVFTELAETVPGKPQNFDRVEEVNIDTFVKDILPRAEEVEVLLENKHVSNMMSLIAPKVASSPSMFKWNNGFSWAYSGNIADSMKQRVKAAGGKVDGVLRFSIQWNDEGDNLDDLDAHCIEPCGNRIYFSNKRNSLTYGNLDVDIITPRGVAVENITWPVLEKMGLGTYNFRVHCYTGRGARSGFSAEIEFDGRVFSFVYAKPLRQGQYVDVANVAYDKKGFSIEPLLKTEDASGEIWGLTSNRFHSVSACMYSPNYWDEQDGIGHRHYLFFLKGCRNKENPNGFFNEFLREDLMEHKRVFEAMGSKMRVEDSDDQLSGLGFSSTKRASLVCKVKGSFSRVIKLVF